MKLLEKTIFKKKNMQIETLESVLNHNACYLKELIDEKRKFEREIDELNELVDNLSGKLSKETAEKKKYSGKCGGLTKQINKLSKELADSKDQYSQLKAEFEEFKKGKYIVKELKAERVPRRRQVMRVKDAQITSNIIAKIKPSEEESN